MLTRAEDLAMLVGRVFIAALFLPSGVDKLMNFSGFVASLGSKGLPHPEVWAFLGVAIEVLGPIALLIGIRPRWTALALVAFTAVAIWTSHRFWMFQGAARHQQQGQFFKDLAIMGGLLFYFACGPGAWSWRGELRRE